MIEPVFSSKIIRRSYEYSLGIIKAHSGSFYKGFSLLPEDKARAVFAIYAFCREADDLTDEKQDSRELKFLEENLGYLTDHPEKLPENKFWPALYDVFSRFPVDSAFFRDMIRGQLMDISFTQPATLADLESYCYFVAGSVGMMISPIIGDLRGEEDRKRALALGDAMQISNILRDVGEDLQNGRIYLPANMMEEYGVSADDLKKKTVRSSFISLWEALAEKAEEKYDYFLEDISWLHRDSRIAVVLSAAIYREILAAARSGGCDVLHKRYYVSAARKMKLMKSIRKRIENE